MKNSIITKSLIFGALFTNFVAMSGNEDRSGSAGAPSLLVNPWSRSGAMGDAGVANVNGLEASFTNIAGLAFTDKTQIKFNYTNWMGGMSGIAFNSAGFAQRVNDNTVFALSLQSMNFGDIQVTTVDNPEGGIGVFSPRINVFNAGFAKSFSSSIHAGLNFKVITESMSNMRSMGVAFDAGIRYVTGEKDHIKFGITLKNVGPTMKYKGDGIGKQATYINSDLTVTLHERMQSFEMPSLLNIGASYDFIFNENSKLTAAFAYTANSFSYDQYRAGLDYVMSREKIAFSFKAGYVYEKNVFSVQNRSNALVGPTAGFSVDALVGKNKNALGIEYCARLAGAFGIIHTFGTTINLK
ncbi:MAG: PorV/PorQ family protein [Flavobacteriia bacterium]|nr:PorV/PorQ family protein [Flavobacteriia bacterium]